jgi:hypothetical protein
MAMEGRWGRKDAESYRPVSIGDDCDHAFSRCVRKHEKIYCGFQGGFFMTNNCAAVSFLVHLAAGCFSQLPGPNPSRPSA